MRLIDADALASELSAIYDANLKNTYTPHEAFYLDALDTAIRHVNSAPDIMRWVSIKECLPDDFQIVLTYESGEIRMGWVDDQGSFNSKINDGCIAYVTHWMELPKPPTEVTKCEQ